MEGYEELEVLQGFKAYGKDSRAAELSYYKAGPSRDGALFRRPEPLMPRWPKGWANPAHGLRTYHWNVQGCYPCLLANRLCRGRAISADLRRATACKACRAQGLSLRQCAMPTLSRLREDFNDWAWVPRDLTSCHICGKLGPVSQCTRCIRCAIWVCPQTSCRKLARASHLDFWMCCHCLGVPLECACKQSFTEVALLLSQVELPELSVHFQSSMVLPRKAHELRLYRARRRWWQVGGLQTHPFLEATFLDDAAALRKMGTGEYADLQLEIEALRTRMAQAEEPQLLAMQWLLDQQIAAPSLLCTFLLQLHDDMVKKQLGLRHQQPTSLVAYVGAWPTLPEDIQLQNDELQPPTDFRSRPRKRRRLRLLKQASKGAPECVTRIRSPGGDALLGRSLDDEHQPLGLRIRARNGVFLVVNLTLGLRSDDLHAFRLEARSSGSTSCAGKVRCNGWSRKTTPCIPWPSLAITASWWSCLSGASGWVRRSTARTWMASTPLGYAVWAGHLETAKLLLEQGCDPYKVDSCGNSCVHYAAGYGHPEVPLGSSKSASWEDMASLA